MKIIRKRNSYPSIGPLWHDRYLKKTFWQTEYDHSLDLLVQNSTEHVKDMHRVFVFGKKKTITENTRVGFVQINGYITFAYELIYDWRACEKEQVFFLSAFVLVII